MFNACFSVITSELCGAMPERITARDRKYVFFGIDRYLDRSTRLLSSEETVEIDQAREVVYATNMTNMLRQLMTRHFIIVPGDAIAATYTDGEPAPTHMPTYRDEAVDPVLLNSLMNDTADTLPVPGAFNCLFGCTEVVGTHEIGQAMDALLSTEKYDALLDHYLARRDQVTSVGRMALWTEDTHL